MAEARDAGVRLRATKPPDWLERWRPPKRRKPLAVLERAAEGRDPEEVEKRNEDMAEDAPTFFRGAAGVMAMDLGPSLADVTGLTVDVCGDAHLGNFGQYGSPERHRLFDLNDFDEARPGPWEWDICRLAASAVVTARHVKLSDKQQSALVEAAIGAYAETLAVLADGPLIDRWYAMTRCTALGRPDLAISARDTDEKGLRQLARSLVKEDKERTQRATVDELTEDGAFKVMKKQEPIDGKRAKRVRQAYIAYRRTVPRGLRRLLDGYEPVAVTKRRVGEGSLGLRNYLLLVHGRDSDDGLILQVKEATPSQLDFALDRYRVRHEGRRVARMQWTLQGATDPLLGWTSMGDEQYYVRQFRDWKSAPELAELDAPALTVFARLCGTALARAHARSPDAEGETLARISGYIGRPDDGYTGFRDAVTAFARTYADVTAQDREALAAK
jgi:uncharacterized protein (DUF2252 family)